MFQEAALHCRGEIGVQLVGGLFLGSLGRPNFSPTLCLNVCILLVLLRRVFRVGSHEIEHPTFLSVWYRGTVVNVTNGNQ